MLKTLTPGAAAEAEGETPLLETLVRQKAAGTGKELPEGAQGEAEDSDEAGTDPSFAWFAVAPVTPQPAPVRLPGFATAIRLPESVAPGQPAETHTVCEAPVAGPATLDPASASPATADASIEFALPMQVADGLANGAAAKLAAAAGQPEAPIQIELSPPHEPAVRPQPVTIAAIQPRPETVQPLVAAAIEAPAPRRTGPRDATLLAPAALAAAEAPRPHAVTATPDAQQPQLDMRRPEWTASMIERIEALRDASPQNNWARETNIRLAPDALGSVDISIRQEGERVHVRFSAENAAARTLLTEAQPRLAELAESRGLRLGQTSVDAGTAGQGQRHDAAPQSFTAAPASARSGDTAAEPDERIA